MVRHWLGVLGLIGVAACSDVDEGDTSVASDSLAVLRAGGEGSSMVRTSIARTAARLCELAADRVGDPARNGAVDDDPDDGGWDWLVSPERVSHSSEASPENLYGSVALGPWAALRLGASPARNRATLYNAFVGAGTNANVDSPPDFVLLSLLGDVLSGAAPRLARERYDAKVAAAGSATELAMSLRDAHQAAATDGLFAYDLAWLAMGAAALDADFPRSGYRADFRAYVAAVREDVESKALFDVTDPHEPYYTQGLAWSLLALSWSPRAQAQFADVRARLLASQLADGAFSYSADYPDGHLQATAHALMGLALTRHGHGGFKEVSEAGADWLLSKQAENGGFPYTATEEYPLLDAEVALALYLSATRAGGHGLAPTAARAAFALEAPITLPPLSSPFAR